MDVRAELASAVKKRYAKTHGEDVRPKTTAQNTKTSMRGKPAVSKAEQASRSAAKNAAAAALAAKMGARPAAPSPAPASAPKGAGGNGPLNSEEEAIAQTYRKMKDVGLPEGAIRHKMMSDGVSERIMEAVMSGENTKASTPTTGSRFGASSNQRQTSGVRSSLSPEEEKIAAQYRKMLKLRMPEGAVRHKMTSDGVSAKIQDAVFSGESPAVPATSLSSGSAPPISSLSPEEEKIAAQYRKMLKLRMPEGAVRHKMTSDGVSAKIQESVLGGEAPATSSSSKPSKPSGNLSSLSKEDEKVATQYRKMMKMGLPEGAMRHRMNKDGVAVHIQDSVIREEIPAENPSDVRDASTSGAPPRPPANPMAAAIASSGGIGALKKKPVEEQVPVSAMPSNPLAAAISSSGGIGALKKTSVEKIDPVPAMPSNPLAAAIAASGGKGALKKTTVKNKDPLPVTSSNPLAAAIAASGGQSGLRKTQPTEKEKQKPKSTGNLMLDELSSRGFQSGLKKSPLIPEKPKSTGDVMTGELSKDFQSGLKKTPLKSKKPKPTGDVPTGKLSKDFQSGLEKTPPKPEEPSPPETSNTQREVPISDLKSGLEKSSKPQEAPPKTTSKDGVTKKPNSAGSKSTLEKIGLKKAPSKSNEPSNGTTNTLKTEVLSDDLKSCPKNDPSRSENSSVERSTNNALTNKISSTGGVSGVGKGATASQEPAPKNTLKSKFFGGKSKPGPKQSSPQASKEDKPFVEQVTANPASNSVQENISGTNELKKSPFSKAPTNIGSVSVESPEKRIPEQVLGRKPTDKVSIKPPNVPHTKNEKLKMTNIAEVSAPEAKAPWEIQKTAKQSTKTQPNSAKRSTPKIEYSSSGGGTKKQPDSSGRSTRTVESSGGTKKQPNSSGRSTRTADNSTTGGTKTQPRSKTKVKNSDKKKIPNSASNGGVEQHCQCVVM
eukprot:CAMPEP_0172377164 /NCGR_PEP_ID=MMETSP1060-20121228/68758_1 /TAXON_ID=37318 /ORGANISM="Pseudo-nitzschia pungens, Strain cf. cingulata" /LENGTH=942 /DNA_ID=CAMNT_0013104835 /DNA_START=258 /DNA_END=3086 /DNA_ORIENTATION=-